MSQDSSDEIAQLSREVIGLLQKNTDDRDNRKREKKADDKINEMIQKERERTQDQSPQPKPTQHPSSTRACVQENTLREPRSDAEGNAVFDLNQKKKVRISKFKGAILIDFREYWDNNGEMCPTKKGVSLTLDAYYKLKELMPSIDN